jgi:hypothetical protein
MRRTKSIPFGLAVLGRGEEQVEDVLGTLHVLHGVGMSRFRPAVHLPSTLRAGAREDQAAHEVRSLQGDLLGDEATDGEAEQVHL